MNINTISIPQSNALDYKPYHSSNAYRQRQNCQGDL